jgi:hypothetical protein
VAQNNKMFVIRHSLFPEIQSATKKSESGNFPAGGWNGGGVS